MDTAADAAGNVYIADAGAGRIYRALAAGVVVPFLDGLQSPGGVALDREGNLYYTDTVAGRVWRRGVSGAVTELGAGRFVNPRGLAVSETGDVFVADSGLGRVLRVDLSGSFQATIGNVSGSVTALAVDGSIGTPWDVAIGPAGTLYVADRTAIACGGSRRFPARSLTTVGRRERRQYAARSARARDDRGDSRSRRRRQRRFLRGIPRHDFER